jgi:hypothetical protein
VIAGRHDDSKSPGPRGMSPEEFRGGRDLIEQKVSELIEVLTDEPPEVNS